MTNMDDYLEHFGVKGMRWGTRRTVSRDARTARLKKGTATRKDKFIREADLDGGRTQQIRAGEIKDYSKKEKLGMVAASAALTAYGLYSLKQLRS